MTEKPELSDRRSRNDTKELLRSVSERPPSDAPYLAESTARYILKSHSEDWNEAAKERDVEEVLSSVPLRITRLLYDFAILSKGNYLDDLDENWSRLEQVPNLLSYATRYSHGRETASNHGDFYFNLGFDVGLGLSSLTGTVSEDSRASKFSAGFTTAFSTNHFQVAQDKTGPVTTNHETDPERRDLLEKYGVEPTEYINRLIQVYNQGWSELLEREPLATKEATQEFLEVHVGEWFGKCSYLRKELDREWKSIGEASTPGMSAEESLTAIWELKHDKNSDKMSSETIAKRVGKDSRYKGSVSQVLNRLSVNGKDPADIAASTFEAEEIVQYNGKDWELTDYGQLLLYHVFRKGRNPEWIQETAIGHPLPSDEDQRYSKRDSEVLGHGVRYYYDN